MIIRRGGRIIIRPYGGKGIPDLMTLGNACPGGEGIPRLLALGTAFSGWRGIPDLLTSVRDLKQKSPVG